MSLSGGNIVRGRVHHIGINVSSVERAREFYGAFLEKLGYRHHGTNAKRSIWLGPETELIFYQAAHDTHHDRQAPGLHHMALMADSPALVDEVYTLIRGSGVEILDVPQEFPEYTPGYYAVFFLDPDGLKVEIAFIP